MRKSLTTSLLFALHPQAERERQYELPQAHRPPKPPKEPYLIEQVFSPYPYTPTVKTHVKGSPLYTDLRLTSVSEGKRSQPSWTIEEYKRNSGEKGKPLTALDLQVLVSSSSDAQLPHCCGGAAFMLPVRCRWSNNTDYFVLFFFGSSCLLFEMNSSVHTRRTFLVDGRRRSGSAQSFPPIQILFFFLQDRLPRATQWLVLFLLCRLCMFSFYSVWVPSRFSTVQKHAREVTWKL